MKFAWARCDWSMCWNLNIMYVLDKSGTDEGECYRKVARNLQLECARVLHETLFIPVD